MLKFRLRISDLSLGSFPSHLQAYNIQRSYKTIINFVYGKNIFKPYCDF